MTENLPAEDQQIFEFEEEKTPRKTPAKKNATTGSSGKKTTGRKKLSKKALLEKKKRRRRKKILRVVRRTLLMLFTLIALAVFVLYQGLGVIFHGPSPAACDLMVHSLLETSALKFVPRLYFTEEELAAVIERGKPEEPEQLSDTSLVVVNFQPANAGDNPDQVVEEDIYVEEVHGATYKGWMMVVRDPSRVIVGVAQTYFSESTGGRKIQDIAERYEAIGAINGGAFEDSGGVGNGGMPRGVTMSEGKLCNSTGGADFTTVGFDSNNVLVVGKMTKAKAQEMGIRDAVSFGPALIVNGEPFKQSSGLNPRTAIGQRADGAVLLLVIDGRQVNSPGASYNDLIDIMLRYGAVNACNLDGGSSSNMYYNGEMLNDGVAITGSRRIPTAFIVR